MKIVKLEAENVKRLQAVEITPDGNLVVIGGENAQGKSSVLDSITMALAGGNSIPPEPVHRGKSKAHIICDLDDIVVTRKFSKKGSSVVVTNKDGDVKKSPQALLDSLTGSLTFDPLDFMRMNPAKQLGVLKELVGLDFSKMDAERESLYDHRRDVNRDIKIKEGHLAEMEFYPVAAKEKVSVAALSEELTKGQGHNGAMAQKENEISRSKGVLGNIDDSIESIKARITDLEASLEDAVRTRSTEIDCGLELARELKSMKLIDLAPIQEKLNSAEEKNAEVDANLRHAETKKELRAEKDKSEKLSGEISEIDTAKLEQMEAAKFPVKGLGFGDDGVLYNGIPFEQSSSAEQLKVSVAMGIAMNPDLKVLLVRDGSYLDKKSLEAMAEMAEESNAQIWIERVGEGDECQIIIEDGKIKE